MVKKGKSVLEATRHSSQKAGVTCVTPRNNYKNIKTRVYDELSAR